MEELLESADQGGEERLIREEFKEIAEEGDECHRRDIP
jgi:hypothetical protein